MHPRSGRADRTGLKSLSRNVVARDARARPARRRTGRPAPDSVAESCVARFGGSGRRTRASGVRARRQRPRTRREAGRGTDGRIGGRSGRSRAARPRRPGSRRRAGAAPEKPSKAGRRPRPMPRPAEIRVSGVPKRLPCRATGENTPLQGARPGKTRTKIDGLRQDKDRRRQTLHKALRRKSSLTPPPVVRRGFGCRLQQRPAKLRTLRLWVVSPSGP